MLTLSVVLIIFFLIIGTFFYFGKGSFLISGYNTSSKEKKALYDELALCKFMSKISFMWALSFLLIYFYQITNQTIFAVIGISIFSGSSVFTLIYANTNNRFKK